MAIYCVTGKLGGGKTLACVGRIRDALLEGKRVATNLDLYPEKMLPSNLSRVDIIRIPDKPTLPDLEFIGIGNPTPDESRNGLIVLDELGAWFNARSWADKARQGVIDWLLHSRKLGWDVYLIIQHPKMLDSQAREGLVEFLVHCRRTDRLRVPFVGGFLGMFLGKPVTLPKVHIATVRYGMDKDSMISDRWVYRARDLYDAYNTRQVFTDKRIEPYRLPWNPQPKVSLLDKFLPKPAQVEHKAKHPMVERIMRHPDPQQRLEWWRRFEQTRTFDR
jgi:hypothetical protein